METRPIELKVPMGGKAWDVALSFSSDSNGVHINARVAPFPARGTQLSRIEADRIWTDLGQAIEHHQALKGEI